MKNVDRINMLIVCQVVERKSFYNTIEIARVINDFKAAKRVAVIDVLKKAFKIQSFDGLIKI